MGVDIPAFQLVVVFVIVIVAGMFRGFSGFGAGLIMAPVLTWVVAPTLAVPTMNVLALAASARLVVDVWSTIPWRRVAQLGVPAVCTVPLGGWLLTEVPAWMVQKVVSGVALVLVLALWRGVRVRSGVSSAWLMLAGACSGVLTSVGGIGGPPVVLALMADEREPAEVRATLIGFFATSVVATTMTFAYRGLYTREVVGLAIVGVPVFLLAIQVGTWLFRGTMQHRYRALSLGLLAIVASTGLLL